MEPQSRRGNSVGGEVAVRAFGSVYATDARAVDEPPVHFPLPSVTTGERLTIAAA